MTASEGAKAARTASERITDEVESWPGVVAGPGRRGEFAFRLGRREIGHLHGDHAAHVTFPKPVWSELMQERRIEPHPVFRSAEGPAARRITNDDGVNDVLALLRLNYDRLTDRAAAIATPPEAGR